MNTKDSIVTLQKRYEQLTAKQAPWRSDWQDLRDYVNPMASDVTRVTTDGIRLNDRMFDGTAPWALEQLASGLMSFLTSPTERWFNLCVEGYKYEEDYDALVWLEHVADVMYRIYADARVNFNDSFHEAYQDLGSFGTAVVYQEYDWKEGHLCFRTYPLSDCVIDENSNGTIDTLFRRTQMATRQIEQLFPDAKEKFKKIKDEKNQDKQWAVLHAVFPRSDRSAEKLITTHKKFASFWFCKEADAIFLESGYDQFPYHVPRWTKRAGEIYGRSPGMVCLADVKMINAMEKVQLKAIQKIVDPPLLVPSDGFALPIRTTPGSLIFYENGLSDNNMMKPLETKGRVEVGEDKMQQKRDHIMRCFYADWISRFKKKERQSQVEVMDDRDEMLRLMSPILGRQMTELLSPTISRTYALLNKAGIIPMAPTSIQGRKLGVVYSSPAAQAQLATKGTNMMRYSQTLIPYAQVDPTIMDIIDTDKFARELSKVQNVPSTVLRSPEEMKKIRDSRQQQQQAAQLAATAEPASKAVLNLATAKEKAGTQGLGV